MKLLVISSRESDLSRLLGSCVECDFISTDATNPDLTVYDGIAVLGGTDESPLIFNAYLRESLERFADTGKPLFLEYVNSFRCVYSAKPTTMMPHRLVCTDNLGDGFSKGELLDSRCNSYIHPHFLMPNTVSLLYYRQFTPSHDKLDDHENDDEIGKIALFKYENVLTAAFRMCDWQKAYFTPTDRWDKIINYILRFLGVCEPVNICNKKYIYGDLKDDFNTELDNCIQRSVALLKKYLVAEDGSRGIYEGVSHNIHPDGKREVIKNVRTDCTGEAAGTLLFTEDAENIGIAEAMLDFCYGPLTTHGGEYDGMVRWSEEAWNVCYQDDVARAIIPSMLASYLGVNNKYIKNAHHALDFLCRSSCKDGLRPARTDVLEFMKNGTSVYDLKNQEKGFLSAHYNSWYSAALLLGYLISGNSDFKEAGIKGLEALMSVYPETVREHSETSELCRLIFPLAVLYKVTDDKKHYEMLDRVFNDLMSHKHKTGGFCEWDTGYKASCFNNPGGECSLLSKNGDPVSDLLYSINWLPLGFGFAYFVTGEQRFKKEWQSICEFFIKTQVCCENEMLDGGWCRGMDLDRLEYVGIPHDVGWGPCCVETGWTVAEITTGMLIGKKLIK